MTQPLAALAAGAPAPVFVVGGPGTTVTIRALRLCNEVDVVDSPRQANVLVVVGELPQSLEGPARAMHDQLSLPRVTVRWSPRGDVGTQELAMQVVAAHRQLLDGTRSAEPFLGADEDPAPWRGVGPYGQGGTGMTGGTPYGRPLTGRAPDRDGLQLDQVSLTVGPFFAAFPVGLVLHVKLQGDVLQEVAVEANPFARAVGPPDDVFRRALRHPVPIADLELARARHHLGWLSDALRIQGLGALGRNALAVAERLGPGDGDAVAALVAAVRRSGVLRWSVGPVGHLSLSAVAGRGLGPLARAAGIREDARQLDPAYQELGFEPVLGIDGDARARWEQRLAETAQAVDLAGRPRDRLTGRTDMVEAPRGPLSPGATEPAARLLDLVPEVMVGLEWGDAVAALASLDVDIAEAARSVVPAGAPG
ncbi:MAG: hypothetical protein ACR2HY_11775 [Acidimicrobiales bacterium]